MVIGSDDVVVISAERRGHLSGDSLPSLDELRAGDETAYERLVTVFSPWMQRIARKHVQSAGLAEDIVQETWLAVLSGLDAFQGRSSLKTWIFQILVNQAKSAGRHERRVIAMNPLDQRVDRPGASAGWPSVRPAASPDDLVIADETARIFLPGTPRSSPCVTSRASRRPKRPSSSGSAMVISGFCSIAHGSGFGQCSAPARRIKPVARPRANPSS